MNALLAFPIYFRRPAAGAYAANTAAMDWFVIATLCFFFFLLGCIATAAWVIWKRSTRPAPHVKLLMELEESDEDHLIRNADEKPAKEPPQRDPWEKEPEWWKQ
ncbi:hypothetical protein EI77_00785 [Prosthecobacter fusiformis]|uniref:Cbb3-type cytochrome oxidase component FixQ n=1 Tax=Prosthecobacter fusiformis TaxID=48464 RepID=A0A4R7SSK5_9BACT|nr:hypothetical protein [Prosthecobacter fusiformis]TDU81476.1 hypothetical protein EI77_00785 [Prosthecobacter fusiformis]